MPGTIGRSLGSFIFALALLRITGRKSMSQLNYFDFLTVDMMGGLLTSYITNPSQGLKIFMAPLAITAADFLADLAAIKNRSARKILVGKPVIFIKDGRILEKNIAKMRYNIAEILAALREKNIFDLGEIEYAILEVDGKISVIKKSQNRPVTPQDLKIPTSYEGPSTVLVSDGKVIHENLRKNKLGYHWLEKALRSQGINNITQVFLASLATNGSLYVDLKRSSGDGS